MNKFNQSIFLSDSQKKELDKRLKLYEEGKLQTKDWEEVHRELKGKYKK